MATQCPNPNFKALGEDFVRQYYVLYDDPAQKLQIANFYHCDALLTFEGDQKQGKEAIMAKHMAIPGQTSHAISRMDCHPTAEGGVLIAVLGQVKNEGEEKVLGFTQTFILKPHAGSFFIFHEIFQLTLHNF